MLRSVLGISCLLLTLVSAAQDVTVDTASGRIQGLIPDDGVDVTRFYGIPYATPPVGALRWMKPQPAQPWNDTFIAQTTDPMGVACMQPTTGSRKNYNTSEDCLTLNVYTPRISGPPKAVLFHIHGGGFARGTAREYEGKFLAAKENIVIVTINYRLGIFGFFDSDGDGIWENFGLWDMKLALQWVQQNIAAFGGDSNRVTVFGGSAGGMAVTMLGASPEFSGLFHRMIGDSGTLTCPKLIKRDPQEVFNRVLKNSGCEDRACLMQVNSQGILNIEKAIIDPEYTFPVLYTFAPFQDGQTILADPFEAWSFYRDGKAFNETTRQAMVTSFQSYDYMAGFNTQEGSLIVSTLKKIIPAAYTIDDGATEDMVKTFLNDYLSAYFPKAHDELEGYFRKVYLDGVVPSTTPNTKIAQEILNMYTDLLFATPTIDLLDSHSEQNQTSTYMFSFTYESEDSKSTNPRWFRGAQHTDERIYVFGKHPPFYGITNYTMTAEESYISDQMMSAWGNFIKTGNPNGANLHLTWHPYTRSRSFYMLFGAGQVDVSSRLLNVRRIQAINDNVKTMPTDTPATTAGNEASSFGSGILPVTILFCICTML